MIIGIIGHRLHKLPTNVNQSKLLELISNVLTDKFIKLSPSKVISGLALGTDQIACEVCLKLNIPYIAAVPFNGQELFWDQGTKNYYYQLLEKAERVEIINRSGFASWKMQARNQWIVDNCDLLIALLSGSATSGGTFNCLSYAKTKHKDTLIIDPEKLK